MSTWLHIFLVVDSCHCYFSAHSCVRYIDCQVPDYRDLIKNPMDFATIRRKVDLQMYRTVDDVAADFQLMISNCMTYNAKNTIFYRAAVKLMNQVWQYVVWIAAYYVQNIALFCYLLRYLFKSPYICPFVWWLKVKCIWLLLPKYCSKCLRCYRCLRLRVQQGQYLLHWCCHSYTVRFCNGVLAEIAFDAVQAYI